MFTSPTGAAGDVEFQIVADDGFRLWLDGTVVMEANSIGQHTVDGTVVHEQQTATAPTEPPTMTATLTTSSLAFPPSTDAACFASLAST